MKWVEHFPSIISKFKYFNRVGQIYYILREIPTGSIF